MSYVETFTCTSRYSTLSKPWNACVSCGALGLIAESLGFKHPGPGGSKTIWVVVKIMVPFWVLSIIRH